MRLSSEIDFLNFPEQLLTSITKGKRGKGMQYENALVGAMFASYFSQISTS